VKRILGETFLQKSFPQTPIGANLRGLLRVQTSPSPRPLPPGERVFITPSLDGRGKGEGDNMPKSLAVPLES